MALSSSCSSFVSEVQHRPPSSSSMIKSCFSQPVIGTDSRQPKMSTFTESQRIHLLNLWSKRTADVSRRIHDDELDSIRAGKEQRASNKKKRQESMSRKRGHADTTSGNETAGDRSQKLAEKARNRLAFSRFRSMNEFLYTHTTGEAVNFMDEQSFQLYHSAYSEIADKWPIRPIDHICERMGRMFRNKGKGMVFADMGCGSRPRIAEAFPNATVHSFDLISNDPRITQADVSDLPLSKNACDCVVFSLSLMGSNIADQVREASRVLKEGGILIIAEVTSRFKGQEKDKKVVPVKRNNNKVELIEGEGEGDDGEESDIDSVDAFVSKLSKLGLQLNKSENLEPNNFFVVMEFTRSSKSLKKKNVQNLMIKLKACQYKPR